MDATLEKLNINWAVFEEDERKAMEKAISTGASEHLAAIINSVTPEKAAEIAKIQAQLRPRTFTFTSSVQKEFEQWLAQNGGQITPEQEREWQEKIDKEKAAALAAATGGLEAEVVTKDTETKITVTNKLSDLGLTEPSIEALQAAGFNNIDDLKDVTQEKLAEVVNPLVAANILKALNR